MKKSNSNKVINRTKKETSFKAEKGKKLQNNIKLEKKDEAALPVIGVLIPFSYGEHTFQIIPTKPWGHYEHFLLNAVVEKCYTAQELSEATQIPYQLIIEVMILFMRVGWVVLIEDNNKYYFAATTEGIYVNKYDELPNLKDPVLKKRSFIVDPITIDCYRFDYRPRGKQSFQVYGKKKVSSLLEKYGNYVAKLVASSSKLEPSLQEVYACVARQGEEVISIEANPFNEGLCKDVRYVIAEVNGSDEIIGIPNDLSDNLKDAIIKAAQKQREKIKLLVSDTTTSIHPEEIKVHSIKKNIFEPLNISSEQYEIILGGEQHKEYLLNMIDNASSYLIIHSSFVGINMLRDLMPDLLKAAERSVKVNIMWGQVEPGKNEPSNKREKYQSLLKFLEECQHDIYTKGLAPFFEIHSVITGSHSKFIICDHKEKGHTAIFGSCNWLASQFYKVEASILVNSDLFVSDALRIASILAKGKTYITNNFSQALARLSNELKSDKNLHNLHEVDKTHACTVRFVGAEFHEDYILKARDNAEKEIFVCSHRVSRVADNSVLPSMLSNGKAKKTAIYGRATGKLGGLTTRELNDLKLYYEEKGFNLVIADEPEVHAKILAWDNDEIVISSLNWLSAYTQDSLNEIGVYLKDNNVNDNILNSLLKDR